MLTGAGILLMTCIVCLQPQKLRLLDPAKQQPQNDMPAQPLQHQTACQSTPGEGCAALEAATVSGHSKAAQKNIASEALPVWQTAAVFDEKPASGSLVTKQQLSVGPKPNPLPVPLPGSCPAAADSVTVQPVQLVQSLSSAVAESDTDLALQQQAECVTISHGQNASSERSAAVAAENCSLAAEAAACHTSCMPSTESQALDSRAGAACVSGTESHVLDSHADAGCIPGTESQAVDSHASAACLIGTEFEARDNCADCQESSAADNTSVGPSNFQPEYSQSQADVAAGMHTLSEAGREAVLDEDMPVHAPIEHTQGAGCAATEDAQKAVPDVSVSLQPEHDISQSAAASRSEPLACEQSNQLDADSCCSSDADSDAESDAGTDMLWSARAAADDSARHKFWHRAVLHTRLRHDGHFFPDNASGSGIVAI